MKLRYFIPVLVAVVAMFTGCSTDDDAIYLDNLRVSSSYVSISKDGGSTEITLTATSDWQFEKIISVAKKDENGKTVKDENGKTVYEMHETPEWLTVSPLSGAAGEAIKLSFSAEAAAGRTAALKISCAGQTQEINVIQGLAEVQTATCAEVIAGADSKTYRVTGVVTGIANTVYGNWYMNDGTGEIYIYGTLDKSGKDGQNNSIAAWGIEVGDEVTVEGPKTTYNGTVELVNVTVLNINKSLIKIDSVSTTKALPAEGGEMSVILSVKGNGVSVNIPEEAKDWLVITGMNQNEVKFRAMPNEGDFRKATVTFTTTDGKKTYTAQTVISQEAMPDAPGSEAKPFTVAEAIAKCQEIGATASDQLFYAKGKISGIKEVSTKYGNATFNISDDGKDENFLTCYRCNSVGGEKFAAEDEISVGDEVIICGKLVNYTKDGVSTPQFAQGCYIVSIKKGNAAGTLAKPFTPAEANAYCESLGAGNTSEEDVYIKGKIIEITEKNQFGTTYGNGTFYISADGTDSADKFYVYRALYLGNEKYSNDSWLKPQAGDEVIICGKVTLYNDTKNNKLVPETAQGKAYVYSINGKTTN